MARDALHSVGLKPYRESKHAVDTLDRAVHATFSPDDPKRSGKLNPVWVEWLMGFPEGWTELKPWAMP
jgi:hypothetical protein